MMQWFLSGRLWKLCTAGAAVIAFALGVALYLAQVENRRLVASNTDYIQRLALSESNASTMRAGLQRQNDNLQHVADEAKDRLDTIRIDLEAVRRDNIRKAEKIKKLMETPPQGTNTCERYEDIDKRFLETLQ